MTRAQRCLAGALGGFIAVAGAVHPAAADTNSASYLFAISAKRGTIAGIGADTGKEILTLTLKGVNDHATQSADRPFRDAYVLTTSDLSQHWRKWFRESPPNAVLTFNLRGDPMPHSIVVELKKPRYRVGAHTLTFTARHIHRGQGSKDAPLVHRRAPARFVHGSLFIDSVWYGDVVRGCHLVWGTNCSGMDLSGADLSGAVLAGANFTGTDLSGADLSSATLEGAILYKANLSGANLTGARIKTADLPMANLRGAILHGTDMRSTDLSGTDFTGASVLGANFAGANFSFATWVDGRACAEDPAWPGSGTCE